MTSHERHDASNHQQIYCLFNSLFKLTTKNTSKVDIIGLLGWEAVLVLVDSPHTGPILWKVFPCHENGLDPGSRQVAACSWWPAAKCQQVISCWNLDYIMFIYLFTHCVKSNEFRSSTQHNNSVQTTHICMSHSGQWQINRSTCSSSCHRGWVCPCSTNQPRFLGRAVTHAIWKLLNSGCK